MDSVVTQAEVERFLYTDAALLDAWKYDEWLQLLAEDVTYEVPAMDRPVGDPGQIMWIIKDNAFRIRARVRQLSEGRVLSESPHSRTRRLITNVRILEQDKQSGLIQIAANFAIYRMRDEKTDLFLGMYEHTLLHRDGVLKIQKRRSVLDNELRPHGKLTIIL
jgi:p-cumate 2,3-dioxygenase subunit beta